MSDAWTDRDVLTTEAYATDANLAARQSIYAYREPPDDFHAWALDQIRWAGNERVLDVGCGNGAYLKRLPDHGVLGLDLSHGMLRAAREAVGPGVRLAVADAGDLPLPDDAVDVVLAMHMLYHVPDIERAVGECRRVLRPGGVLLAVTNALCHQRELDAVVRQVAASDPIPRSAHRFSLENGEATLRTAFAEVERQDRPGTLRVPEVAPLVAYLESTRSLRERALPDGTTWAEVVDRARERFREEIARNGAFEIHVHAGAFVCR